MSHIRAVESSDYYTDKLIYRQYRACLISDDRRHSPIRTVSCPVDVYSRG